jgi:hypothetical protein
MYAVSHQINRPCESSIKCKQLWGLSNRKCEHKCCIKAFARDTSKAIFPLCVHFHFSRSISFSLSFSPNQPCQPSHTRCMFSFSTQPSSSSLTSPPSCFHRNLCMKARKRKKTLMLFIRFTLIPQFSSSLSLTRSLRIEYMLRKHHTQ